MSLICDLQEDLTEEIWAKVTSSLVCTEIDNLVVNLNNNSVDILHFQCKIFLI